MFFAVICVAAGPLATLIDSRTVWQDSLDQAVVIVADITITETGCGKMNESVREKFG